MPLVVRLMRFSSQTAREATINVRCASTNAENITRPVDEVAAPSECAPLVWNDGTGTTLQAVRLTLRRWDVHSVADTPSLPYWRIKDMDKAVRDKGKSIYAWCFECATAKVVRERSCMLGNPLELKGWICDECLWVLRKRSVDVSTVIEDT
ncbi:hypothetical protein N7530_006898 [Penicillium desertorum]|uniref:Uncharacterized protein n=1 Tax=Penicillium desertorum TaxID=1303715 RepID=A0A9X0BN23_9EURO|nr:hypothetical protein N7530_006898 [Penicillium desertorum]